MDLFYTVCSFNLTNASVVARRWGGGGVQNEDLITLVLPFTHERLAMQKKKKACHSRSSQRLDDACGCVEVGLPHCGSRSLSLSKLVPKRAN